MRVDTGMSLNHRVRILIRDWRVHQVVPHLATVETDRRFFFFSHEQEILRLSDTRQYRILARKILHSDDARVPLAVDDDRMNQVHVGRRVGDDGSLIYLPVAVEVLRALFEDADGDAVQVEVGQLTVGVGAEVASIVGSEDEDVHELGVVGVVDAIGEGFACDDRVDDRWRVVVDLSSESRVAVAVQDSWDVIAVIYFDEFAAQRVAVAMLEEYEFTGVIRFRGRKKRRAEV